MVPTISRARWSGCRERTGGALALVSGRPIADLDLFFPPLKLPAIGGHGAELRAGAMISSARDRYRSTRSCAEFAERGDAKPGIVVEDKGYSLALHYRQAPHHGDALRDEVIATCARLSRRSDRNSAGQIGVRSEAARRSTRATAVRELMHASAVRGPPPVFIGDDVTDEAAFEVLPEFGGMGFSVGRDFAGHRRHVSRSPSDVRDALRAAARATERRQPTMTELRPRPRGDRQRPHRRAGQPGWRASCGGAFRASTATRCSAACSRATRKRASPTSCSTAWSRPIRNMCAIPPSSSPSSTDQQRRRGAHHRFRAALPEFRPHLPPAAARCASSSRSPACRASPSASARRTAMACRSRDARVRQQPHPLLGATTCRCGSPPTRRSPISRHEASFVLTRPVHMVFGTDEPFEGAIDTTCREFCDRTRDYWLEWVRRLAVLARMAGRRSSAPASRSSCATSRRPARSSRRITTSIPEAPRSGRNWDYRYCWMRDAYLRGAARSTASARRARWRTSSPTSSRIATGRADDAAAGLRHRARPIRSRSASRRPRRAIAATGRCASAMRRSHRTSTTSMAASSWRRRRCSSTAGCRAGRRRPVPLLEPLGEQAARLALEPDAGIWEYRGRKRVHTHSAAMCWAGCQRLEAIARASRPCRSRALLGRASRGRIGDEVLQRAWNPKRKAFTAAFGSDDLDASVLLLAELGADRAKRSALRLDRGGDRAGTSARPQRYALCRARMISACRRRRF